MCIQIKDPNNDCMDLNNDCRDCKHISKFNFCPPSTQNSLNIRHSMYNEQHPPTVTQASFPRWSQRTETCSKPHASTQAHRNLAPTMCSYTPPPLSTSPSSTGWSKSKCDRRRTWHFRTWNSSTGYAPQSISPVSSYQSSHSYPCNNAPDLGSCTGSERWSFAIASSLTRLDLLSCLAVCWGPCQAIVLRLASIRSLILIFASLSRRLPLGGDGFLLALLFRCLLAFVW